MCGLQTDHKSDVTRAACSNALWYGPLCVMCLFSSSSSENVTGVVTRQVSCTYSDSHFVSEETKR